MMRAFRTLALASAMSVITASAALAQATAPAAERPAPSEYTPQSGQPGKDVIWLPTQDEHVRNMLDMAGVTKDDYVVDLGSGDGRTVIFAAQRGARAHGIEYNPDLVALSKRNAEAAGVADRATFEQADIFESDFSKADVVTLFLLPELNLKLRPTLLEMEPGTRVVSNSFDMQEWEPDDEITTGSPCASFCDAYNWVVPAQVEGTWRMGDGQLALRQSFQMLSGTLTREGTEHPISEAKMNGREITFRAGDQLFRGVVADDRMAGEIEGGAKWEAARGDG